MGKMKKCKVCGAEIAKSASVCPSCGAKQKKHVVLGIVLTFLGVALLCSALGNSSSNSPQKVEPNSEDNSVMTQEPSTEQPAETTFGLGDTVSLNDIKVTLKDVSESSGSQYNQPSSGNEFVAFNLEIENNSGKEIAISSLMSFSAYFDDYASNLSLTGIVDSGDTQLDGTIANGKKMSGSIAYEAPTDWKTCEIHVKADFWSGKDIVFTYSK